jgi:hypothetical protein
MDRMFCRVAVDGSTSFVASQSGRVDCDSSDDEAAEELEDQQTPVSVGTNRTNSNSTTASSPSKKSKSPAVRAMDKNMCDFNQI